MDQGVAGPASGPGLAFAGWVPVEETTWAEPGRGASIRIARTPRLARTMNRLVVRSLSFAD